MSEKPDEDVQTTLWRTIGRLWEDNKRLRAAVAALEPVTCDDECAIVGGCVYPHGCPNETRADIRRLAGLED